MFVPGSAYSYDLGELGRYHRAYESLMEHWRNVLRGRTMLDVEYEQLIGDPETHMRRLLSHCGLEWEDACLAFYETERVVATPTRRDVRKRLYGGSVGQWRQYREYLGQMLHALEHDVNDDPMPT